MIKRVIKENQLQELKRELDSASKIVVTCHVSPDGDAIGSALGLLHVLEKAGKHVRMVTPDMPPQSLNFMPGIKDIVIYTRQEVLAKRFVAEADLIVCLDFNTLARIDRLAPWVKDSKAKKVLIDHHLEPDDFADVCISYPKMSSTCELLFNAIYFLDMMKYMSKKSATCIYTGMMTDTGNFTYNANSADTYRVIAELMRYGIDKENIYRRAMNTYSADRLRLMGYALSEKMELFPEVGGAMIVLDKHELGRFRYQRGDTESLVNRPLTIPGIDWSMFLREDSDYIKVSARSQGDFAVNTYCEEFFNGGGHKNASGGEFYGTLEECKAVVYKIVEDLKEKINTENNKDI